MSEWTIPAFKRAHVERMRNFARAAGRVTRAVAKSAFELAWSCAAFVGGGFMILAGFETASQPDSVLLQRAIDQAQAAAARAAAAAANPSTASERDTALIFLAFGVFVALLGVGMLIGWWQSLPPIRLRHLPRPE